MCSRTWCRGKGQRLCGYRLVLGLDGNQPCVTVSAIVHLASLRVVGAQPPGAALGLIARPSGGEVESWRGLVGTVFRWTRVIGACVPRGVLLPKVRVRAGGVGTVVGNAPVEEVVAARLQTGVYTRRQTP